MALKQVTKTVYVTSDGKEFTSEEKALQYETFLQLDALLIRDSVGRGGHWDLDMIRGWILDNQRELVKILFVFGEK